jgi:ABC-type oligopeptide transport system substrate-binding subunit
MRSLLTATALLSFLALAGCQHYYMIQEPAGGKVYYADHFTNEDSGAVQFKDLQTGAQVTLQSSVVKEVNKGDLPDGLVH